MKSKVKYTTIRVDKAHAELLRQIAAKLGTSITESAQHIIEEHMRVMKSESKLKAKLRIEDMDPAEALALLGKNIESIGKTLDFIVAILRTQEREILNPTFNRILTVAGIDNEILSVLKSMK